MQLTVLQERELGFRAQQPYRRIVLLPLLSGLGTGLALIVAIGVQNAYLLRLAVSAGVRVVVAAVVVCAASDAILILAGVLGVGAVVERFPAVLVVVRFIGAAFLVTYGVLAARRASRPSGEALRLEEAADDGVPVGVTSQRAAGPTDACNAAVTDPHHASGVTGPHHAVAARRDATVTDPHDATTDVRVEAITDPRHTTGVTDPHPTTVAADRYDAAATDTRHVTGATGVTDPHPTTVAADRYDAAAVSATTSPSRAARSTRTVPPGRVPTIRATVATMLVLTWANPHVYLDTLVFLGSVANQQGPTERWPWTAGAVLASCLWFAAVGFGGRLLRPLFAKPLTWRVFDGLVAVVMLGFGIALVVGA